MPEPKWKEAIDKLEHNNWNIIIDEERKAFQHISKDCLQGADLSLKVEPTMIADLILHEYTLDDIHHTCPLTTDELNSSTQFQVSNFIDIISYKN
jgi:hypothetical protein